MDEGLVHLHIIYCITRLHYALRRIACGLRQACGGGRLTVRLSMAGKDGSALMDGWHGPSGKDESADAVLCMEVIDDGVGFGSADPMLLFLPFYLSSGTILIFTISD